MKTFECGLSVKNLLRNGSESSAKTFVCILDAPQDYTMHTGMVAMLDYIKATVGDDCEFTDQPYTIKIKNNTYTLAHEVLATKTGVTHQPSGILRHVLSRIFTAEALYIEDGAVIDLTQKGIQDIANNVLRSIKDVYSLVNTMPECIARMFEVRAMYQQLNFNGDTKYALEQCKPTRLLSDFVPLQRYIETDTVNKIQELFKFAGLKNYLIKHCGIQLNVMFASTDEPFDTEQPISKNKKYGYNDDDEADELMPPLEEQQIYRPPQPAQKAKMRYA